MNIPSFVDGILLWIPTSVFVFGAALLTFFITRVVRIVRGAPVVSVPLLQQQDIVFSQAGRMDLCIEGPRFTTRFAHLEYELSDLCGAEVKGHSVLFRTRTSGISRIRLRLKSYEIPNPGRYVFRIHGLERQDKYNGKHRIVFARPSTLSVVCCIVGIVFSSFLVIGSIVLFLLRILSGNPPSIPS